MNRGILITLPQHDEVTTYVSAFSKDIIKEAKERDVKIKKLSRKEANKKDFEEIAKRLNYNMFVFNGHGQTDSIFGHDNQVIIEKGVNDALLDGKITYARACDAATELGKSCNLSNSEGCFIGYELPFILFHNPTWETNPLKDKVASVILEPSNLVPISIIKGNSTNEANEKSKNAMLKSIKKVLREPTKETNAIALALWNNYSGQVLLGNSNAKI